MARRIAALLFVVAVACTSSDGTTSPPRSCKQLGLSCTATRFPNVVLHGDERDGALRSVDGFDLSGILSFDQALKRGWSWGHIESKTIRVVLGSANAGPLHWGTGRHLYYAVEYGGPARTYRTPRVGPGRRHLPPAFLGTKRGH